MMVLRTNPLCSDPFKAHEQHGEVVVATDVHHVQSKRDGGPNAEGNLVSLCHACHSRLTAEQTKFERMG